jgi:hypothetical protein
VSGDISNVRDICNARQIIPRPTSDISTSLGTSSNIWQRAFISDLSGITRINGATWPLTSGTSDFSGLDINTNLIPRNPLALDLGSSSKYWRNAYIRDLSVVNFNVSENITITGDTIGLYTKITTTIVSNSTNINLSNSTNMPLTFSNDGNVYVVTASESNGIVRVYKINLDNTGTILGTNGTFVAPTSTEQFGYDVALSSDGTIIAIGSRNANSYTGKVVVYKLTNNTWTLLGSNQATILVGRATSAGFGESVKLSGTGTILSVSSLGFKESNVFEYSSSTNTWTQLANTITSTNSDQEGRNTALSLDGLTFASGGSDFSLSRGRVRIFRLNGTRTNWDLIGTITGNIAGIGWNDGERVGTSLSLSSDGNIIAVGACGPATPYVVSPYNVSSQGSVSVYRYTNINSWAQIGETLYGVSVNDGGETGGSSLLLVVSINNSGRILSVGFRTYVKVFIYNNSWNISLPVTISGNSQAARNMLSGSGSRLLYNVNFNETSVYQTILNNSGIGIRGNIIPLNAIASDLGSSTMLWRNAYIQDLSVANISVSGNILSTNNNSQVPVSYNTFSVVSAQNRTLLSYIGTISNVWTQAFAYDISKVVLSNRSFIKIEVKVNYTASPEADQTLSFRVLESFNRGISFETNPVFSDISLGSSMGVTINNIYNGSYYDDLSGVTLSGNIITYRLEFRRDCPVGNTIKTGYGIQQSTGNYMSLQELYRP